MALNKKKKNKSNANKKNNLVKQRATRDIFIGNRIKKFIILILKPPFLLINLIIFNSINFLKKFCIHFYNLFKNILALFSNFKDAVFGIIFGLLSGCIGAVLIFSYLDINTNPDNDINSDMFIKNLQKISELETSSNNIAMELKNISLIQSQIDNLSKKLDELSNRYEENIEQVSENSKEMRKLLNESNLNSQEIKNIKLEVKNTSELMLSSSKSVLSNRLYLAQSLIDRLQSGVPYAPQLVALGKAGLNPALLRFAKGGAPTNIDLTARLSARAGELRDSYKTKSDLTWRDNLKDEISKYVKVKPTNSENIKGMNGVLLRAEEAISRGNLKKAISEINSLEPNTRGVLNAWLNEAKAKESATVAAENLLARTTAALRKRN